VALVFDAKQKAWVPSEWTVVVVGTGSGGRPLTWGVERNGESIYKPPSKRARAVRVLLTFHVCRQAKDYVRRAITGEGSDLQVAAGSVDRGKAKIYPGPAPNPKLMVLVRDIENPFGNGHKDPKYDFRAAKVFRTGEHFVVEPMEVGDGPNSVWRPMLKSYTRSGSASEGSEIWNLLMGSGAVVAAEPSLDSVLVSGWAQRSHCDSILENLIMSGKLDYEDIRAAMISRRAKSAGASVEAQEG
jgi:hypothetical protein